MISRGDVKSIRELSGDKVQAQVCLGSDVRLGSAIVQVELTSAGVREALQNLRDVIAAEALSITAGVIEAHRTWQSEVGERKAARAEGKRA